MSHRSLCFVMGFGALVSLAQGQVTKAVKQSYTPPRAVDGHADLQGVWVNNNATPLERPKELAGKATLTDQELAAMKKKAHELFGPGQSDAAFGDTVFATVYANVTGTKAGFKSTDGETGDYSTVWTVERDWENRTSLVTDPPDGRIPALTPEAQQRRGPIAAGLGIRGRADGPEDRPLQERCITYGSPSLTAGYQSGYQIVQSPSAVAITTEMIHDTRMVRLDGSPHPPSNVQAWLGDSRGHWEGDTLIIDTTNYKPRAFRSVSSDKLHVIERISRMDADHLRYEITIDDPGTWAKPWSLMIPLRRADHPLYEYACHEGNYGMAGILAGARKDEEAAAQPK